MGLRQDNIERRRQRILTATRELIERDGVDGWSMRKVADAANVSVPTIYNLFGSKDEIRSAIWDGAFDDLDRGLDVDRSVDRPVDRALAVVERGVARVVRGADKTRPALLEGYDFRKGPRAIRRLHTAVEEAIDEGQLRGDLRVDLLVAEGYGGFRRAAVSWARGEVDPAGFRAKALYSMCVCLLAVATDDTRDELLHVIRDLESELSGAA